jgi:hypothetical protein
LNTQAEPTKQKVANITQSNVGQSFQLGSANKKPPNTGIMLPNTIPGLIKPQ